MQEITPPLSAAGAPLPKTKAIPSHWTRHILRALSFAWKWLAGAASCQAFPLALIGAGWSYRLARRSVLKTWWKQGLAQDRPKGDAVSFRQFARTTEAYREHERTPNWIVRQNFLRCWRADDVSWRAKITGLLHSLGAHLWLGFRAWAHSMVFLGIPSGIMMVSWYSGWDNSFNKGYEQFDVGAILGLIGIGLFILAMFYLPMAQARFAVTQSSRSFYQFHLIRRVIRRRWLSCLGLAAGYALAGLPLMAAGAYLGVATAEQDSAKPNAMADYTPAEALQFLENYYFFWGFYVFAAFVILHCWAARIYARGITTCVQTGRLQTSDLSPWEEQALTTFRLPEGASSPRRRFLWLGNTWARVFLGGTAAIMLWFSVAAQNYVTQFFAYQPEIRRWLNQPLIQVPWFQHIPKHLK